MSILPSIKDEHPFVYAHRRFLEGELLVEQAILLVESDQEFVYNAVLSNAFKNPRDAAEQVVRKVWCLELCELIAKKRGLPEELGSP